MQAWFTLQGDLVGVSGIPVRLVAGQPVDPTAWYSADGHRAAIAGPFRNEAMNKQGYLRGSQILAAEKLALAAQRRGWAGATAQPVAPAPQSGLKPLDWTSVTVGSTGAAVQFAEWDLVKEGKDGVERWRSAKNGRWYPTANQPNGVTGPRAAILEEAGRFGKAGRVCFVIGTVITVYQFVSATRITPHNAREAEDRQNKMNKAGLDLAIGVIGLLGPIGFAISTVYFIVDTAVAFGTNGSNNILDIPALLVSVQAAGPLTIGTPHHLLEVAADHTRLALPRRVATPSLAERLRQTPLAAHNAVFRPATR